MSVFIVAFFIILTASNAQWTVNPIQLFRNDNDMAVGAYSNSIYLLGGGNNRKQLIQYNILNDTLQDHGALALPADVYVNSQGYTQINNILYIIAGSASGGISFKIFDMLTLQMTYNWGSIRIPIDVRDRACLASTTTHLFVMGGGYNSGILNAVQMLQISTQSWRNDTPSMIKPRAWFSCIVEPNTQDLYAIGGGDYSTNWKSIEKIQTNNIEQNSWEYIPGEFSQTALFTRSVAYNGYIFVVGGANNDAGWQYFVDVHVINPSDGSVSVLGDQLVYGVYSTAAIVVDSTIYAFGGGNGVMYTDTVNTWMTYDLSTSYGTKAPTLFPTSATSDPTTTSPTTKNPTIAPTTTDPTTSTPTTHPITEDPTTSHPTTVAPTTSHPTTVAPTTSNPTTIADLTTVAPTTSDPTTVDPTTSSPTTSHPTTTDPTTSIPTTIDPTTSDPTTVAPTTSHPTTVDPTTVSPIAVDLTTSTPTTTVSMTYTPTTREPTAMPTTLLPTTSDPTTILPIPSSPTTDSPTLYSNSTALSNTELIQLILDGDFGALVAYLIENGIELPEFALNTIETLMKKSNNPNLDKVIVNIINVHSGSIVIEYSISSDQMYLLQRAIGNIDDAVGSDYTFHDFTFSVLANRVTIMETTRIESVDESSAFETKAIVIFVISMIHISLQ